MKVYVITQGGYSDYSIRAVSLDKDDAERKCAILNRNVRNGDYCEMEEYDTEDMVVETNEEVKRRFELTVYRETMETVWPIESHLTFENINKIQNSAYKTNGCIDIIATLQKDTAEEQAKKIMLDRVAKFKAERAGL